MSVIIIIPIYKKEITPYEQSSLKQLIKVLVKYTIILLAPKDLDIQNYHRIDRTLNVQFIEKKYFESVDTYNSLMLSSNFYKMFLDFDFILIYQLDSYVFSDQLSYWCNQNYDYIGAPWTSIPKATKNRFLSMKKLLKNRVGNGGFSLRKTKSMYKNLKYFWILKILFTRNEDIFFGVILPLVNPFYVVPKSSIALKFAVEMDPAEAYVKNNFKLPFGTHAWEKYDLKFWRQFIS